MKTEQVDLLYALLKRTLSNRVQWEEINDDSYRAKLGAGMVRIERIMESGHDDDGEPIEPSRIKVWVISDNGGLADVFEVSRQELKVANDLVEAARSSAMNTPLVYQELLQELGNDRSK